MWEPMYETIIADFGFERGADEQSRDRLEQLCGSQFLRREELPSAEGQTIAIAGGAKTLREEIDRIEGVDLVFSASTATEILREFGHEPALHITDLDKDEELTVDRSHRGQPVILHAHGDNRGQLETYVPQMNMTAVLPTTQSKPTAVVKNFGGFTDGDRAAFLAHALGAEHIEYCGWNFDDPNVTPQKRRKLDWAERLLHWLERRRDECFGVLDERRDRIELPPEWP